MINYILLIITFWGFCNFANATTITDTGKYPIRWRIHSKTNSTYKTILPQQTLDLDSEEIIDLKQLNSKERYLG